MTAGTSETENRVHAIRSSARAEGQVRTPSDPKDRAREGGTPARPRTSSASRCTRRRALGVFQSLVDGDRHLDEGRPEGRRLLGIVDDQERLELAQLARSLARQVLLLGGIGVWVEEPLHSDASLRVVSGGRRDSLTGEHGLALLEEGQSDLSAANSSMQKIATLSVGSRSRATCDLEGGIVIGVPCEWHCECQDIRWRQSRLPRRIPMHRGMKESAACVSRQCGFDAFFFVPRIAATHIQQWTRDYQSV